MSDLKVLFPNYTYNKETHEHIINYGIRNNKSDKDLYICEGKFKTKYDYKFFDYECNDAFYFSKKYQEEIMKQWIIHRLTVGNNAENLKLKPVDGSVEFDIAAYLANSEKIGYTLYLNNCIVQSFSGIVSNVGNVVLDNNENIFLAEIPNLIEFINESWVNTKKEFPKKDAA